MPVSRYTKASLSKTGTPGLSISYPRSSKGGTQFVNPTYESQRARGGHKTPKRKLYSVGKDYASAFKSNRAR